MARLSLQCYFETEDLDMRAYSILPAAIVLAAVTVCPVVNAQTDAARNKEKAKVEEKKAAPKEKPKNEKTPSAKDGAKQKTTSPKATANKPAVKAVKKPAAPQVNRFVDRDGDGIHDGKEHRFRRRASSRARQGRTTKLRGSTGTQRGRTSNKQKGSPHK
jgi:hypothetical protein